jgi:NADP-dependent 3-hydroxy acid dehydrogenase YdfG
MKILITGATNGMGKGVAKVLAGMDHQMHELILLGRSEKLGAETIHEIRQATANQQVSLIVCDLANLGDVRAAIREIKRKHAFLDGIFINAGLGYAARRVETADGMDSHFQVNYLAQFMLTIHLLDLLKNAENGGRVIFNVTRGGNIRWDDLQMKNKWSYVAGIRQAMVAKRMLLAKLHRDLKGSNVSFIGFEISKTVWSNQITIIPASMRIMAHLMKLAGGFISIERCGEIMAPLFTETQEESLRRSGKLFTWKKNAFVEIPEDMSVLDKDAQDRLWNISLDLCADEKTARIAANLPA